MTRDIGVTVHRGSDGAIQTSAGVWQAVVAMGTTLAHH